MDAGCSRAGEDGSNEAEFGRSTAMGVVQMLGWVPVRTSSCTRGEDATETKAEDNQAEWGVKEVPRRRPGILAGYCEQWPGQCPPVS
jgi:hypothetical protein